MYDLQNIFDIFLPQLVSNKENQKFKSLLFKKQYIIYYYYFYYINIIFIVNVW